MIAANTGAASDESRDCLTALGRARPEFAYVTFGAVDHSPAAFDPEQLRPFAREFYNCFEASQRVDLTVGMMDQIAAAASVTGREFVDAMADDAINCFLEGLGMSREAFEIVVETAFAAGSRATAQGPDCLSPEDITEIFVTVVSKMLGGMTDESAACVREFAGQHPEYMELMALGDFDPESISEEEFAGIASPGLDFFDCLTVAELLPFQALVISMVT